ncbi:hypothetical protein [Terrarubrum flagellatum]|uniref:hypothetical protein n=1 Tax=Terrirubrum flagellatum TaxID=2895980 RepID=UPI003144F975
MEGKLLEINLFGACTVRSTRAGGFVINGTKHKALFVLLATAPFGRRTRSFLQETLWGAACYDTGRQSLRRALADIKAAMGGDFGELISGNNSELTLDLGRVHFAGRPGGGQFLEGLEVREPIFNQWVAGIRAKPDQLDGLFSLISQPPATSILPSIAVLPFRAVGGDALDGVLGDWLAEEICRSLSRSRLLAVISHLSCRQLARQAVDVGVIRTQLQANYFVSGTLRRSGERIIVDADFVDVRTARILWTRQFEQDARNFLDQCDEGCAAIVRAAGGAIADEALQYTAGMVPASIDDHRLLIAGVSLMHRSTLHDFARARELIEEALRRAPSTSEIHAWLGKWHVLSVFNGWSTDARADTQRALDCTARALDLSPDNAFSLTIDGFAQNNLLRRLDIADKRYAAALGYNPNEALSWLLKGTLQAFRDEGVEAVAAIQTARRLSPIDPFGYFYDALSAGAHLSNESYDKALEFADRSLLTNDRHLSTIRIKITALHHLGRDAEARVAGEQLIRRQPDFTVESYLKQHPATAYETGKRVASALRASGIP